MTELSKEELEELDREIAAMTDEQLVTEIKAMAGAWADDEEFTEHVDVTSLIQERDKLAEEVKQLQVLIDCARKVTAHLLGQDSYFDKEEIDYIRGEILSALSGEDGRMTELKAMSEDELRRIEELMKLTTLGVSYHIVVTHVPALIAEVRRLQAEIDELLDALEGACVQGCDSNFDELGREHLDSMFLGYYAEGLRLLSKHNRFEITHNRGRGVKGYLTGKQDGDE